MSEHPLYTKFMMAKQYCTNKNTRAYRTHKGRWGKNSVGELTKHYKKAYEQKVNGDKKERWAVSRINLRGKFEIGNIEIISVAEVGRKRIQTYGNPAKHPKARAKVRAEYERKRKPVDVLTNGKWKQYPSATAVGKRFGTHRSNVSYHCRFRDTKGIKDKKGNLIQVRYAE